MIWYWLFKRRVRRFRFFVAIWFFCIALFILVLSFSPAADATGRVGCRVFAVPLVLVGLFFLWRARRTPKDQVEPPIWEAPPSRQVQFYRRMLWATLVAFPCVTFFVAYDLCRLESNAVDEIQLYEPIASIYSRFGFWPATLSAPVLGVACAAGFLYVIRKLRKNGDSHRV